MEDWRENKPMSDAFVDLLYHLCKAPATLTDDMEFVRL